MAHSTRGTLGAWPFLDVVEGLDRLPVEPAPPPIACQLTGGRLRDPFSRVGAEAR